MTNERRTSMGWNGQRLLSAGLVFLFLLTVGASATSAQPRAASTANQLPRKVIVGTTIRAFWREKGDLDARLALLTNAVDRMSAESKKKYGRNLDLAVLPENAVTANRGQGIAAALPFEGRVQEAFARKAREHRCYIVVPMSLLDEGGERFYNAAVLVDRNGKVAGVYRKLHLAVLTGEESMEDGATPGKEVPVFECDFGRLGIQICFDMEYDYGWAELARKGADLVAWPTASPQTAHPAVRAMQHRYWIVSSPFRHNASIFEPTGKIAAQIRPPQDILVEEIDLSYALLPWSPQLRNGALVKERYGDKAGFRYYEEEDIGIFWSNDPKVSIGEMIRSAGLAEAEDELIRIRGIYDKAGVPR